ncbi:MAG: VCBS repeat-containing protein [Ignavibacteriae bacterium]|nr:VCBS repeat-containing protein [Ignavibacteriota bacterium]MCB9242831.1 VCBS repeat-containing protein [Ignavibacteriales bacterium]
MKTTILITALTFFISLTAFTSSYADNEPPVNPKTYTKQDIEKIAEKFLNNNLKINEPAIVDVDGDNVFDILNFSSEGNVEFYRNTGSNEAPVFVLEDKEYGDVGTYNTFFDGMPVPVFFADADGDNDLDVFAVMGKTFDKKTNTTNYEVQKLENSMFLDHYTLITIILVLVIVVLLIAIL